MGEHAAVAEDLKRPEIMDGFRMPHGNNDTELAGRARAFIKALGDLKLHDAFVEHGLEDAVVSPRRSIVLLTTPISRQWSSLFIPRSNRPF